jgi:hypothetical protein
LTDHTPTRHGPPQPGIEDAYLALAAADDVLARPTGVYGYPDPFEWFDGGRTGCSLFAAMVLHITSQRISAAAAFTIFDRMTDAGGSIPEPDTLLPLGADRLRALGLSGGKARCILELARRQAARLIDLEGMDALSDDDVISALTAVPWHRPVVGPGLPASLAPSPRRTACGRHWNPARHPPRVGPCRLAHREPGPGPGGRLGTVPQLCRRPAVAILVPARRAVRPQGPSPSQGRQAGRAPVVSARTTTKTDHRAPVRASVRSAAQMTERSFQLGDLMGCSSH